MARGRTPEPKELRVLMVSPEVAPYATTGGLGNVLRDLPVALRSLGVDVRRVMPKYRRVAEGRWSLERLWEELYVPIGNRRERCAVCLHVDDDNITTYFLEHDGYFDRDGFYGTPVGDYEDNAERFVFFTRGVLEMLKHLRWAPHVIHCHEWQAGLLPAFPECRFAADPAGPPTATLMTIHNVGYQGRFAWHLFNVTGLGWEEYVPGRIEFYGDWSMLKAGLVYADLLNTVSPNHSKEIQTPRFGHGLDGVLRSRRKDLYGVLNGIDYRDWNPATDANLVARYGLEAPRSKERNKAYLLRQLGLKAGRVSPPLLGMVGRLSSQKGIDLLVESLDVLIDLGVRVAILGSGEERYCELLKEAGGRYPGKVRGIIGYDERLARQIYAGADFFLMPSRYEPCGLAQMIALAYGTIPIVHRTGGLVDTVVDYGSSRERGKGFLFSRYTPGGLVGAVRRGIAVYDQKDAWKQLRRTAMSARFTWDASAKKYLKLYRRALSRAIERARA